MASRAELASRCTTSLASYTIFGGPLTRRALTDMATSYVANLKSWERDDRADMLQRALRHLILSGPDAHLH